LLLLNENNGDPYEKDTHIQNKQKTMLQKLL